MVAFTRAVNSRFRITQHLLEQPVNGSRFNQRDTIFIFPFQIMP